MIQPVGNRKSGLTFCQVNCSHIIYDVHNIEIEMEITKSELLGTYQHSKGRIRIMTVNDCTLGKVLASQSILTSQTGAPRDSC